MAVVYCEDHVLIYTMHTSQDHSTTISFSFFLPPPFLLMSILYSLAVRHHYFSQAWWNLKKRELSKLYFHIHSQEEISNENENSAHKKRKKKEKH